MKDNYAGVFRHDWHSGSSNSGDHPSNVWGTQVETDSPAWFDTNSSQHDMPTAYGFGRQHHSSYGSLESSPTGWPFMPSDGPYGSPMEIDGDPEQVGDEMAWDHIDQYPRFAVEMVSGSSASRESWEHALSGTHSPSSPSVASNETANEAPRGKRRRVSAPPDEKIQSKSSRKPRGAYKVVQNRRFHNVVDGSQSTMLGSGSMFITFPVEKVTSAPQPATAEPVRIESCPPALEHGPTQLPPRPYHVDSGTQKIEKSGSASSKQEKSRKNLPNDVMDHLPALEGRLCRIEIAAQDYLEARNRRALEKSLLPVPHSAARGRCRRPDTR